MNITATKAGTDSQKSLANIMSHKIKFDNEAAVRQLKALGYKAGEKVFLRFFYPSKDSRQGAINLGCTFPNFPIAEIEEHQNDGMGCYFVVNGQGNKKDDVTLGRAIFYEHDDLSRDIQIDLWKSLNLPEPSLQVDTGGKSIHSYWIFDEPIGVNAWKLLQGTSIN
jgi:hypothetical protein